MAAAFHRFYNGAVKPITTTGRAKNNPHGNPAGDQGPVNKTPGAPSAVTGK